jgi:ABC-type nickel/cobalt efflux system permease component RcnA
VAWGLGHSITLLIVGGVCLALRSAIPPRLGEALEAAVGLMLLGLGGEVLWRLRARRVHVHAHRHADGVVHLHAHSHVPEAAMPGEPHHHHPHPAPGPQRPHREQPHEHPHGLPRRALLVGLMHGLAGSAALLLVTLSTLTSAWLGLAYIAIFGAGSILGMAALSAAIAMPLRAAARVLSGWYNALEAAIAVVTILIGAWVIYQTPWP